MVIWIVAQAKNFFVFFGIPRGVVQAVGGIKMRFSINSYFHDVVKWWKEWSGEKSEMVKRVKWWKEWSGEKSEVVKRVKRVKWRQSLSVVETQNVVIGRDVALLRL